MSAAARLLVTGASGSIGTRLRERLERDGRDGAYVVSPRTAVDERDCSVYRTDVTDADGMRSVVEEVRPAAIIHLASITGAACDTDPDRAAAVNVDAVRSLSRIAHDCGVDRFVFASTSAVYGDQYDAPVAEDGALVLGSLYARTKREAELELQSGAASLTAVALRIFNVYGPGMSGSLANRLVESSPASTVTLAGLDSFVRDYVHVDDVVDALLLAADASLTAPWSVVNVGSGHATSNRDLVTALAPVHFVEAEPRSSYSCADVALASGLLDFTATRRISRESVA